MKRTMDSPRSVSNSFDLLDERIRRWIWQQGWDTLRASQEEAIPAILRAESDVIISAPTSAGKTEAAFLPVLSSVLSNPASSVRVLYVGPLKALINDQFSRLDGLCEALEIPVHRWHGDVTQAAKAKLTKSPSGILLITPESLEAVLMRQGSRVATIFAHLAYIIVDEVHSFMGTERGAQLQSLLHRLDTLIDEPVPRIGLSATLAQPELAAAFLRPGGSMPTTTIVERGAGEIRVQLSAFYKLDGSAESDDDDAKSSAQQAVVEYFIKTMAGQHNLIFCNRKSDVEMYSDALSQTCVSSGRLDEFCAHHGSLSKELREEVEIRLKNRDRPTTCVCTSTLEMGIDIGAMKSIGQVGPPPSVASLRQRVGRSGRRGEPSILRLCVIETRAEARSSLIDRLHLNLIQSAACVELMAEGWCESSNDRSLHLSTLIQQCMSVIVQRGGASIAQLYKLLLHGGLFSSVSQEQFVALLRAMKDKEIICQMDDGTLLLGVRGERIAEHFSFYCAFSTPEEYQLVGEGRPIGSMPLTVPLKSGDPLIFGGKRWQVVQVDDSRKVVTLIRSRGKRPPRFQSEGAEVDCEVRKRMFQLLNRDDFPPFMNPTAKEILSSARATFTEYHLGKRKVVGFGRETLLFHWCGDLQASTLRLMLSTRGLPVEPDPSVLVVNADAETTVKALDDLLKGVPSAGKDLAATVGNKLCEKHDWILSEDLLIDEYASRNIDVTGALLMARTLLDSWPS